MIKVADIIKVHAKSSSSFNKGFQKLDILQSLTVLSEEIVLMTNKLFQIQLLPTLDSITRGALLATLELALRLIASSLTVLTLHAQSIVILQTATKGFMVSSFHIW